MNPGNAPPRFFATGEAQDFRQLVEEYQHRVFRLVASVLGPYSDAEAEDVTQEVFLQVHAKAAVFRQEMNFGTWIYAIARNRAIDRRRQARFRLPHVAADALQTAVGEDDADRRLLIAQCLEALPEIYRTLLYMYYWQGASVEEISEYTGLVPGTVKSYLARGRQRVEAMLRANKDRT
ncbi:MAG: RNA polymerase sigma factor [Bryobacterales bacterium]|nr:RNA polymerase sigma factor [Bryobacterales bacterium]